MYTASYVSGELARMKAEGLTKAEIINVVSDLCIGWPYVFGAYGQDCTPAQRNKYAGYRQDHAAAIRDACPVLGQKQSAISAHIKPGCPVSCENCDWNGTLIADCRGFTRLLLQWVGLSLYGGTVTAQWEYGPNWAAQGNIDTLPRGLVCCVFRPGHTGMYVGNDTVRHCGGRKGQVVEEKLPGTPRWERWGIPAGLYTNEELRKAGLAVDESKNIPTLRRGSQGDEVADLQMLLNSKYGYKLDIDGDFGSKTESAVKDFQRKQGLTVDGIVGPKTWKALGVSGNTNPPADNGNNEIKPSEPPTQPATISIPLTDWQEIKAAVMTAYHIIKQYEG